MIAFSEMTGRVLYSAPGPIWLFGGLWYDGPEAANNAVTTRSFSDDHMMPWFAFTMLSVT
ncbi:MAG: hypothetical protein DME90_07285 [Verrucomicrobia bacterium]|nr:MAG: hypothetical protein DME90_07285 [Verrucomicrobiota bacterium]